MRGPRVRASDVTGLPCALQWRNPARVGLCRPEWSLLARLSAGILFWRAFVRFLIGLENNLAVARAWGSLQRLVEGIWAEHNLTGHQLSTLRLLLLAKGNRMTVKDITASLSIGSTNVTKLVNSRHPVVEFARMQGMK